MSDETAPLDQSSAHTRKVPPKGTPERKEYDKNAKRRSRERARENAASTPTALEWWDQFPITHPAFERELVAYREQFSQTVKAELEIETDHNHYSTRCDRCAIDACLDQVACTLLGQNKQWVRNVQNPFGEMVAGRYFPDSLGAMIVEAAHRYELEKSETFKAAYRELLRILDKKYGSQQTEDALAIRAELAGTFQLPPEPRIPKAPEPAPLEPPMPSFTQIVEQSQIRMMDRLREHLSPEAQRYLHGN